MQPRFSLKWLLIAFTTLSIAFYLAYIRPTVQARSFVARVEAKRGTEAWELLGTTAPNPLFFESGGAMLRAEVNLLPRDWSDLWHLRRRTVLQVFHGPNGGLGTGWSQTTNVAVYPLGSYVQSNAWVNNDPLAPFIEEAFELKRKLMMRPAPQTPTQPTSARSH